MRANRTQGMNLAEQQLRGVLLDQHGHFGPEIASGRFGTFIGVSFERPMQPRSLAFGQDASTASRSPSEPAHSSDPRFDLRVSRSSAST